MPFNFLTNTPLGSNVGPGVPSGYEGLLGYQDPAGMGLLGAAGAALSAGGRSPQPVSIGQAIGQGLMGFAQAQNQARRTNALNAVSNVQLSELLRRQTAQAQQEAAVKDLIAKAPEQLRSVLSAMDPGQVGGLFAGQAFKEPKRTVVAPGAAVLDENNQPIFTNPKSDRPSSDEQLLEAMGLTPGTPEYRAAATQLFNVKGKPLVSIDMGHKADEKILEADIGQLKEAREGAAAEVPMRQRLEMMVGQLLSGTQTGPVSEVTLPLKNMIVEAGLASADQAAKWSDQELFRATSAYLVPRMRVPGSGASSDRDLAEFKASLPGLSKSPQANLIIGASMLQLQEHNAKRVQLMDAWMREKKSLKGFGEYADKEMGALFPTVKEEDVGNLRPGTVYKGTDGKYRVRRNTGAGN